MRPWSPNQLQLLQQHRRSRSCAPLSFRNALFRYRLRLCRPLLAHHRRLWTSLAEYDWSNSSLLEHPNTKQRCLFHSEIKQLPHTEAKTSVVAIGIFMKVQYSPFIWKLWKYSVFIILLKILLILLFYKVVFKKIAIILLFQLSMDAQACWFNLLLLLSTCLLRSHNGALSKRRHKPHDP